MNMSVYKLVPDHDQRPKPKYCGIILILVVTSGIPAQAAYINVKCRLFGDSV
jgi:hypothetical protein